MNPTATLLTFLGIDWTSGSPRAGYLLALGAAAGVLILTSVIWAILGMIKKRRDTQDLTNEAPDADSAPMSAALYTAAVLVSLLFVLCLCSEASLAGPTAQLPAPPATESSGHGDHPGGDGQVPDTSARNGHMEASPVVYGDRVVVGTRSCRICCMELNQENREKRQAFPGFRI